MTVFEFKGMLIELVYASTSGDEPLTLECTDLRSEMLFAIHRDKSGDLVFRAFSELVPIELIAMVAKIAEEELPKPLS